MTATDASETADLSAGATQNGWHNSEPSSSKSFDALSTQGLADPGNSSSPSNLDLMQGVQNFDQVVQALESMAHGGADPKTNEICVQRAVEMLRALHERLQQATQQAQLADASAQAAELQAASEEHIERRDRDRFTRLEAEVQRWRWQAEQNEQGRDKLRKEMRSVYESHHKLGAMHAEMSEAREKEQGRLHAAEAEIARLTKELETERQIANERLNQIVEERRIKRMMREDLEELLAKALSSRDPVDTPVQAGDAKPQPVHTDPVTISALKDLLHAATERTERESSSSPLKAVPSASILQQHRQRQYQSSQIQDEQAYQPPAYVARGLTNSRSLPPVKSFRRVKVSGLSHFATSSTLVGRHKFQQRSVAASNATNQRRESRQERRCLAASTGSEHGAAHARHWDSSVSSTGTVAEPKMERKRSSPCRRHATPDARPGSSVVPLGSDTVTDGDTSF